MSPMSRAPRCKLCTLDSLSVVLRKLVRRPPDHSSAWNLDGGEQSARCSLRQHSFSLTAGLGRIRVRERGMQAMERPAPALPYPLVPRACGTGRSRGMVRSGQPAVPLPTKALPSTAERRPGRTAGDQARPRYTGPVAQAMDSHPDWILHAGPSRDESSVPGPGLVRCGLRSGGSQAAGPVGDATRGSHSSSNTQGKATADMTAPVPSLATSNPTDLEPAGSDTRSGSRARSRRAAGEPALSNPPGTALASSPAPSSLRLRESPSSAGTPVSRSRNGPISASARQSSPALLELVELPLRRPDRRRLAATLAVPATLAPRLSNSAGPRSSRERLSQAASTPPASRRGACGCGELRVRIHRPTVPRLPNRFSFLPVHGVTSIGSSIHVASSTGNTTGNCRSRQREPEQRSEYGRPPGGTVPDRSVSEPDQRAGRHEQHGRDQQAIQFPPPAP